MATIEQLKQLFGTDSNEDAVMRAAQEFGISPSEIAKEVRLPLGGQWGNRAGASLDSYQGNMYGLVEAVTGADWARRGRERNEAEANFQRALAQDQGAITSYKDVEGIGTGLNYLGGLAVDSAPYLLEMAAGGVLGRGLAMGARTAASIGKDLGLAATQQAAGKTLTRASLAGGVAASYPSAVGDILSSQREQSGGNVDLLSAGFGGVGYAGLNAVGVGGAAARFGGFRSIGKYLDDAGGLGGGALRMGATGGRTALVEGPSETGQEFINQYGRNAVDPNAGYFGDEAIDRYKESFVGGAALGGTVGGGLGGWRRSEAWNARQARDLLNAETTALDQRLAGEQAEVDAYWNPTEIPPPYTTPPLDPAYTGFGNEDPQGLPGYDNQRTTPPPGGELPSEITDPGTGLRVLNDPAPPFPYDINEPDTASVMYGSAPPSSAENQNPGNLFAPAHGGTVTANDADAFAAMDPGAIIAREQAIQKAKEEQAAQEELARVKALDEVFQARRAEATRLLVDPLPDGTPSQQPKRREILLVDALQKLKAAETITPEQYETKLAELREAIKSNDTSSIGAVEKEVKAWLNPKASTAQDAAAPAGTKQATAAPAAVAPVAAAPEGANELLQGQPNAGVPVVPGQRTGGSSAAAGPVVGGGVAGPGPDAAAAIGTPDLAGRVGANAGPAAPVAAGQAGVAAPAVDPKSVDPAERIAQLKAALKAKAATGAKLKRGQGGGIDFETLSIYAELAYQHVRLYGQNFANFSKELLGIGGDEVKPYIRKLHTDAVAKAKADGFITAPSASKTGKTAKGGKQTTAADRAARLAEKGITKAGLLQMLRTAPKRDLQILKASMGFYPNEEGWVPTGKPLTSEAAATFLKAETGLDVSGEVVRNIKAKYAITNDVTDRVQRAGMDISGPSTKGSMVDGKPTISEQDLAAAMDERVDEGPDTLESDNNTDPDAVSGETDLTGDASFKGPGHRVINAADKKTGSFDKDDDIALRDGRKSDQLTAKASRTFIVQKGSDYDAKEGNREVDAAIEAKRRALAENEKETFALVQELYHAEQKPLTLRGLLHPSITDGTIEEAAAEWDGEADVAWESVLPEIQAAYVRAFDAYYGSSSQPVRDAASKAMVETQDEATRRANKGRTRTDDEGAAGTAGEESAVPGVQEGAYETGEGRARQSGQVAKGAGLTKAAKVHASMATKDDAPLPTLNDLAKALEEEFPTLAKLLRRADLQELMELMDLHRLQGREDSLFWNRQLAGADTDDTLGGQIRRQGKVSFTQVKGPRDLMSVALTAPAKEEVTRAFEWMHKAVKMAYEKKGLELSPKRPDYPAGTTYEADALKDPTYAAAKARWDKAIARWDERFDRANLALSREWGVHPTRFDDMSMEYSNTDDKFWAFVFGVADARDGLSGDSAGTAWGQATSGIDKASRESIDAKPGANIVRMAKLLGPKLYGSPEELTKVSVKEIFQNSFDAVKAMLEQGKITQGQISITLDEGTRTIRLVDNGSGMTPQVLANQFLQIAGTHKESGRASGGLGIAKMLFLYGNESLNVVTARDGKVATLETSGDELMAALDPAMNGKPPKIDIQPLAGDFKKLFPDGHGTAIEVKVPETFTDPSSNEERDIPFPTGSYSFPVLEHSPLFDNITVTFKDGSSTATTLGMGSAFPAKDYTQLANVNFDWGTARIYVSAEAPSYTPSRNAYILSNGLWQFSSSISLGGGWGDTVQRKFFVDMSPTVRPEDAGYPFDLNRQQFSPTVKDDMEKVFSYMALLYKGDSLKDEVLNFGGAAYVEMKNGKAVMSAEEDLHPALGDTGPTAQISKGDKVEVRDGKLIVNGRVIPELTAADLKAAKIDVDQLKIDQTRIDAARVMVHDNTMVLSDGQKSTDDKIKELQAEQNRVVEATANAKGGKGRLWDKYDELAAQVDALLNKKGKPLDLVPITTAAREKFGERFDKFNYEIGSTFKLLRDLVAEVMAGNVSPSYSALTEQAVGVSYDKEYRGVSIMAPFKGMFVNPAVPEYTDPERAAYGLYGTMVHELAHFKVRDHDAGFPAEMQRILIHLATQTKTDLGALQGNLVRVMRANQDITSWINERTLHVDSKPRGRRFKDGSQQAISADPAGELDRARQGAGGGRRLPPTPPTSGQAGSGRPRDQGGGSGRAAGQTLSTATISEAEKAIRKYPVALRPAARTAHRVFGRIGRGILNKVAFTDDLLKRAETMGLVSAKTYRALSNMRSAFIGEFERNVLNIVNDYNDLPDKAKGRGPGTVNDFMYNSTMQRKWGYQPKWLGETVTIDADTAKAWKALDDKSRAYVDAAFKLGADTLALKKQTVIEATTSEYDSLIKAATEAGNQKEVDELTAEKTNALKQFGTLLSIDGKTPYAPIKRFGKYVVIGESAEYVKAKKAGDTTLMRKLEQNEDDYYVDFAENEKLAQQMEDKLRATGKYVDPGYRPRELERNDLYGGSKTIQALTKLRARADAMPDSKPDEKGAKETARKLRRLLTEMYLQSLADGSARKSELRRRGIAGDIDMIRSLETQGKADANFLGSIKYGDEMLQSINDMRREMREGTSVERRERAEALNEIIARHLQSMDYDDSVLVNRLRLLPSIWFLSTSPSYYIQNGLQPFMLSLPYMAGKHGYSSVAVALKDGYASIAPAFKNAKVLDQMDFEVMLSDAYKSMTTDEKVMVKTLLDKSVLDIGMVTELGSLRLEGGSTATEALKKVDEKLRSVQAKMEAVNRMSTALAAFRLEKAKKASDQDATNYAEQVVLATHGDYSARNAPRAFNTNWGKIGLQFKKYQLIQLTLLAKLLKTSFGEAPAAEKAIARKALAYTLGQAVVIGGGKALPVPFAVAWLFAQAFGDDADEPPEYVLRKMIGNKDIADLLISGPLSFAGINGSALGGFEKAVSVMPFVDIDLTSRGGVMEAAYAIAGGPLGGLSLRMADGVGAIANGDYYKGLGLLLPKGAGSFIKAGDTFVNGVYQRDGDVTMSSDEITTWQTAQQALGFTPQVQIERQFRQNAQFKIDAAMKDQGAALKKQYAKAVDAGKSTADIRADWMKYQAKRVNLGYKRQPLTELTKAAKTKAKREQSTLGGVQYRKGNEKFVRSLSDM